MQDDRLTLDKAVKEAWSFELVKEQQKILKADENGKLREKVNRIIVEWKAAQNPETWKKLSAWRNKNHTENFLPKHVIVVVNRPYTSTINTQQLKRHAQSVQNKEIMLQYVNARLFIQLKRKYRVKPVIQMIAIFPNRSVATKAKRNGL